MIKLSEAKRKEITLLYANEYFKGLDLKTIQALVTNTVILSLNKLSMNDFNEAMENSFFVDDYNELKES